MEIELYSYHGLLDELDTAKKHIESLEQNLKEYKMKEEKHINIINSMQNRISMLEDVFETVPSAIMTVDENRNIKNINRVVEKITMKTKDEIIGKKGGDGLGCYNSSTLKECGTGKVCEMCPLKNSVEFVLKTGKPLFDIEINPKLLINNEVINPWLRINILYTVTNEKKYAVLIIENITIEKRNRDLKEKIKARDDKIFELEEYDKLKDEFLINMSHEFRTPVNIILAAIQLLENVNFHSINTSGYNIQKKYIKMMKQNCQRLVKLINNLIDVRRINSGFLKINLSNHNIVSLIEDITLSTVDYIKTKGLNIIFDTEIEEKIIACDAEKIERVMLNLLSNAVKYTGDNGIIEVNIYEQDEKIIISVKDNGEGIPPNMIKEIFEIFKRGDSSFTRKNEGSGLGLFIVKSIIELHKGNISLNSKYERGSEFIIELPITLTDKVENVIEEVAVTFESNVERMHIEFSDIYK